MPVYPYWTYVCILCIWYDSVARLLQVHSCSLAILTVITRLLVYLILLLGTYVCTYVSIHMYIDAYVCTYVSLSARHTQLLQYT